MILAGDCRDVMPTMAPASVSAIVCDPPYGLSFMGKGWDHGVPGVEFWAAALRVAAPGARLLAFGGTRTYHRLTCAIEDAGWRIEDCLLWLYGSGFPKHKSKLKPAHEPIIIARNPLPEQLILRRLAHTTLELICLASQSWRAGDSSGQTDTSWSGSLRRSGFWSIASSLNECLADLSSHASRCTTETASGLITDLRILKSSLLRLTPSITTEGASPTSGDESNAFLAAAISRSVLAKCERLTATTAGELVIGWHAQEVDDPAVVSDDIAWEPIILAHKPAKRAVPLNVEACRLGYVSEADRVRALVGGATTSAARAGAQPNIGGAERRTFVPGEQKGRWPANVVLDEEAARALDEMSGETTSSANTRRNSAEAMGYHGAVRDFTSSGFTDSGGASRFFYTAKAARSERDAGLDTFPLVDAQKLNPSGIGRRRPDAGLGKGRNDHPTVKPLDLMRWLCRLITPTGGLILDPFCGSGTTGCAALMEGFEFVGIERDPEYAEIARRRLAHWGEQVAMPIISEGA